jgi:transmembrane sensor
MTMNAENLRKLAEVQDSWAEASNISEVVRMRLFAAPRQSSNRAVRKAFWIGGTCTALSLAAAVALTITQKPSTLTFDVGNDDRHGTLGNWVSAAEHETLPLRFSDGTKILLEDNAEARVTELEVKGAHVVLERGKLNASVVHRQGTHWELQAGPFTVFVRGTRFNLRWSPESAAFALELNEGKVDVTGPGLAGHKSVETGQTLEVSGGPEGWHVGKPAAIPANDGEKPEPVSPSSTSGGTDILGVNDLAQVGSPSAARTVASASPTWQELATASNYGDALTLAKKVGLPKIFASGTVSDLTRLAQVARFAGASDTARGALRAIRERFAGSPQSAMATFDLGRLSFDSSGRYLEAAHWFREYLREFPHGNLAREALGRLVESLERGGDHMGAREAASGYLLRYPNGPHAGLSRRLLNQ